MMVVVDTHVDWICQNLKMEGSVQDLGFKTHPLIPQHLAMNGKKERKELHMIWQTI